MNKNHTFLVFDVESIGLHGEGFAVGWTVLTLPGGTIYERSYAACPPEAASGTDASREWCKANLPELRPTHKTPQGVREAFWRVWKLWKNEGALLVADCCWPVEARFLAQCVDDDLATREWEGPYPLHDLASVILANGGDPLATHDRRDDELPKHHPLADAIQSARLLLETLRGPANERTEP